MKNVYDYLKPTNEPSKNGFDLSSLQTFSAKLGQLIPEVCIETVPNSSYRISIDSFTRTMPLNTAAFARIKENRYVCFVPYSQLWNEFNQMIVGRSDSQDARMSKSYNAVPTFNLRSLLADLNLAKSEYTNGTKSYLNSDQLGFSLADGASKLLDMLGYGFYNYQITGSQVVPESYANVRPNLWRILAYNKIWYNFFRNSVYDNDLSTLGFADNDGTNQLLNSPAQMFNLNDIAPNASEGTDSDVSSLALELFRSTPRSISKLFQMRYVPWKQDEYNGLLPDTQFGAVSSIALDIEGSASVSGTLQSTGSTVLKSTAFETQGAYTIFKSGLPTPISTENVGSLYWPSGSKLQTGTIDVNTPAGQSAIGANVVLNDQYSSDYDARLAASVQGENVNISSAQFSVSPAASSVPSGGSHTHSFDYTYLNTDSQYPHKHVVPNGVNIAQLNGADVLNTIRFVADSGGSIDFSGAGFNVLDLVEAQSIQKWRQRALLAGNRTNDNFRAHYGVAPKYDLDMYPDMIGSADNTISIQEVVSTADTSVEENVSNLGDIAGKGYGVSDKKYFNYHANDFGVLMVLYAARPEAQYNSFGLDRANQLVSRNDYFIKEFENNGLEPVSSRDFLCNNIVINLGFAPRFRNYKSVLSKVHGRFNELFGSKSAMSDFQSWVIARRDIFKLVGEGDDMHDVVLNRTASVRYVNPSVGDTIFAQNADSTETTDHFMVNSYIECLATLPLSRLGLPSF